MRATAGRLGLVVAVLTAALVPVPRLVPVAPAVADSAPSIHTPRPMPGSIVPTGELLLRVTTQSDADTATVELSLDGRPVVVARGERDPDGAAYASATVTVAPGPHEASATFTDTAGRRVQRSWSFVATDVTVRRHAGPTRLETAVAISRETFPEAGSASAVLLARADDFADALAGAPLAVHLDAPLLLTARDELAEVARQELRRVLPLGGTVHLLGGTEALSRAVADDVRALGYLVTRHAGEDRYATAASIARALPGTGGALIASGVSFPDALAASAPAARDGVPILLTRRDELPHATTEVLDDRGVADLVVVGGPAVVSAAVEEQLTDTIERVERVAGADRYATAVAVLARYYDRPSGVSLASGTDFPDALTGTRHAAALRQPLLLTPADHPVTATDAALRAVRPRHLDVYGGAVAVTDATAGASVRAVVDGPDAPRVVTATPVETDEASYLERVTVTFDRPVDVGASSVYLDVGDREIVGEVVGVDERTLQLRVPGGVAGLERELAHAGRVTVAGVGAGAVGHHDVAFTYLEPDPWFATVAGVDLHLPSRHVEMIGYHQSSHDGARELSPRDTATAQLTLPSRGRGTGRHTAADIVADPELAVYSPVDGVVVRAGTYRLYCDHYDHYLVIEPDARPGYEVKLLHFEGLAVATGDRVEAGITQVGSAPRTLPFESQVDEYSGPDAWPHVHVEVVDTAIPDRGGGGC
ncbi:MAG: cell wall-binding repeat-containing protein [Actinobacteria bacterium]|nr:cell wall-binding repeat-containing protein [Actinomycetota bacterium]